MKISDIESQRRFFADADKQYDTELVLNPPFHTEREIGRLLGTLGDVPEGSSVADFGAGTGRLSIPLLRMGYRVCSVDISEESLARLRSLAGEDQRSLRTAGTLEGAGPFAAILGTDILHHVPLGAYLPLMRDALVPGGRVAFSEPGAFNPLWYVYLPLLGWKDEKGVTNMSIPRLTRLFAEHGFADLTITGVGLLPRPLFNSVRPLCELNDEAGNLPLLRFFANRYMVEARRA
jgi:SAM-dependent methyltransferase